jgi:hypothetical protein
MNLWRFAPRHRVPAPQVIGDPRRSRDRNRPGSTVAAPEAAKKASWH